MIETTIKKSDDELQIVYGEVYAPGIPDAHGDFMTKEGIRKMAHRFLSSGRVNQIDMQHDNNLTNSSVVESFIADKGDGTFIEDSWVVGVHIPDSEIWAKVKKGDINGFSFEGMATSTEKEIEVIIPDVLKGTTSKESDHEHIFYVKYDDDGTFLGGDTDVVNGHSHKILRGTTTEESENHAHKFSFIELLDLVD